MGKEKLLQKKFYDLLSHRYGFLAVIIGIFIIIISAFQFGEAFLEWSTDKYETMFNSFSDNVGGKSFQSHLCGPVPIDVVYTWVNGSDQRMLQDLDAYRDYLDLKHSSKAETLKDWCHGCIEAPLLVFKPVIKIDKSLPMFKNVKDSEILEGNFTLVTYYKLDEADEAFYGTKQFIENDQLNVTTMYKGYLTSDATLGNSRILNRIIALRGFPDSFTKEDIRKNIPDTYKIESVSLYSEEGLAILKVGDDETNKGLLNANFTIEGKKPSFSPMRVVWKSSRSDDASASRYQDNEELRYSLRSIARFAPWVRKIYLVTNGQIPSWLNLDNSRLKIITHAELFPNKTHLPTFSSPAIESHLHLIPDLSDKFIYMNDDVMFGKQVWPDDFYTPSHGQKVYLSWPVPNCNEGCPNSWIKDGYCDKPCNNSACDWDGGDCDPNKPNNAQSGLNFAGIGKVPEQLYCNTGCANSWLADRYCDQACNVVKCGYDAGDCGVDNYHHFRQVLFERKNGTIYETKQGELIVYFNLTTVFEKVTSAEYEDNPMVRTAAVANKFHVFSLMLFEKYNASLLNLTLSGIGKDNSSLTVKFHIHANTQPVKETALIEIKNVEDKHTNVSKIRNATAAPFVFKDVAKEIHQPHILSLNSGKDERSMNEIPRKLSVDILPGYLAGNLSSLLNMLNEGDLSDKGFQRDAFALLTDFAQKNNTDLKALIEKLKVHENISATFRITNDSSIGNSTVFKSRNLKSFLDSIGPVDYTEVKVESFYVGRRLLDTFGDSLRHVNKLYNKEFGFGSRKVPGHMPHFIDKNIFATMQSRFREHWDETSSHKIRSGNDMQFAFSYFYFLMSEPRNVTHAEFFDEMDVDMSGVLSDREIRTMATRLYEVPIDLETLTGLESKFKNCSSLENLAGLQGLDKEFYYDKAMPQVTKTVFVNCDAVTSLVDSSQKGRKKYKYQEMGEDEIAFKMVRTNMSSVVTQLDDIRKNPRKFICLNDNIDHRSEHAQTVKNILHDFYESFFPIPSQFELPLDYRNRFLYIDELREWQSYRDWLKLGLNLLLCALVIFSITSYFEKQIETFRRKVFGRRRQRGMTETV